MNKRERQYQYSYWACKLSIKVIVLLVIIALLSSCTPSGACDCVLETYEYSSTPSEHPPLISTESVPCQEEIIIKYEDNFTKVICI